MTNTVDGLIPYFRPYLKEEGQKSFSLLSKQSGL